MKIDLSIYDKLALNMKSPKMIKDTVKITKLPDDFEPKNTDHPPDEEADFIAKIIP